MGQYRQWLHYRQVDQQLHALKNHLTAEIQHIDEENAVAMPPLASGNRIMQALLSYAKQPSSTTGADVAHSNTSTEPSPETISPFFERSRLPNFELLFEHATQQYQPTAQPTSTFAPLPPLPHRPQDPRSDNASSLPDSQQQTEPQTVLPWWLRQAALSAPGNGLDQQSIRTNRLVQRWLERWGRQDNADPRPAPNDNGHPPIEPGEGAIQ